MSKQERVTLKAVIATAAVIIGSVMAVLTSGCGTYHRSTTISETQSGTLEYRETVSAGGLWNNGALSNARSMSSISNGVYEATKGLESAETSGNADLLREAVKGAVQGARSATGGAP